MHSGFNGLQSGLSSILLIALLVKSWIIGNVTEMFAIAAIAGAVAGFWWFNKFPARIFEGNIGAMAKGAAIGCAIVVSGAWVGGFIMLIPHTINFLMYVYWRIQNRRWQCWRRAGLESR